MQSSRLGLQENILHIKRNYKTFVIWSKWTYLPHPGLLKNHSPFPFSFHHISAFFVCPWHSRNKAPTKSNSNLVPSKNHVDVSCVSILLPPWNAWVLTSSPCQLALSHLLSVMDSLDFPLSSLVSSTQILTVVFPQPLPLPTVCALPGYLVYQLPTPGLSNTHVQSRCLSGGTPTMEISTLICLQATSHRHLELNTKTKLAIFSPTVGLSCQVHHLNQRGSPASRFSRQKPVSSFCCPLCLIPQ